MKASISFGLKTLVILGASVALGLSFNANRENGLPLDGTPGPVLTVAAADTVSVDETATLLASGGAVVLDARDADIYAAGHIAGALSMPLYSMDEVLPDVRARLEHKTIITYCDGEYCELSHDLADQLRARGFAPVVVLVNGWTAWQNAGLATETSVAAQPEQQPAGDVTAPEENTPAAEPAMQDNASGQTAPEEHLEDTTAPLVNTTEDHPAASDLPMVSEPEQTLPNATDQAVDNASTHKEQP